jgi:hypothetical protein
MAPGHNISDSTSDLSEESYRRKLVTDRIGRAAYRGVA